MNDWKIIGHDWAVRRLQKQIEDGQLAQSHLITGPPSVGKATLAKALARAVLARDAVDATRAQRLVDNTKHPDLTWVGAEDGSIRVDLIRDLLHTLTLAPLESRFRVAVVDDAHLATDSSKNALLKTLEEPNPAVVIILIAPRIEAVLPTISSRCQILSLRPVPRQTLLGGLLERNVERSQAERVALLARGSPGWALRAVENNELLELREQRLSDLERMLSADRFRRFEYAETLSKADGGTIQAVLDEWALYWRDVVRVRSARDRVAELHNADHGETIRQVADRVSIRAAVDMIRVIGRTNRNIRQNASARLGLDVMLLGMPVI